MYYVYYTYYINVLLRLYMIALLFFNSYILVDNRVQRHFYLEIM